MSRAGGAVLYFTDMAVRILTPLHRDRALRASEGYFLEHFPFSSELITLLVQGFVWLYLTINGLIGTVLSDFLWLWAVLLTSPLVATVGLRYLKCRHTRPDHDSLLTLSRQPYNTSGHAGRYCPEG